MPQGTISIYTDGSYNRSTHVGGWAAIIQYHENKIILQGTDRNSTHQRMELTAVIKAIEYVEENQLSGNTILIYTDSQYVAGLRSRKEKLTASNFMTKKNTLLGNHDLLRQLFLLEASLHFDFIKVKAHQKTSAIENLNREADILCRKIVRTQR
jgi:ribonuclease HI